MSSIWLACCLLLAMLPIPTHAEDGSTAVEQIALDRATLDLAGGETETLYASLAPDAAAGSTITWTSGSNAVAAVSSNGEVTAVGPGTAVVTASAGGKSAACTVTVSGVVMTSAALDLLVSNSAALGKAVYGNAVSVSQWRWKSSDPSIAWVSAAGLVTGVAVGTAAITCYNSDSAYMGTFHLFYSGCDTAGNVYDGEISITVSSNTSSNFTSSYTGYAGKRLYFDTDDFSDAS